MLAVESVWQSTTKQVVAAYAVCADVTGTSIVHAEDARPCKRHAAMFSLYVLPALKHEGCLQHARHAAASAHRWHDLNCSTALAYAGPHSCKPSAGPAATSMHRLYTPHLLLHMPNNVSAVAVRCCWHSSPAKLLVLLLAVSAPAQQVLELLLVAQCSSMGARCTATPRSMACPASETADRRTTGLPLDTLSLLGCTSNGRLLLDSEAASGVNGTDVVCKLLPFFFLLLFTE